MGAIEVRRLGPGDLEAARQLNALFGEVFDDPASYSPTPPGDTYLRRLLGSDTTIALVAQIDDRIVGALTAYIFAKLEQERSEIYIYDLAVAESARRRGVATALIGRVKQIAAEVGAWVVYVQADYGDEPAIALYAKLGRREEVMHFDIAPQATR